MLTTNDERVQNHNFTYDENIKVESVTQAVADLALRFGEGANEEEASMVRLTSINSLRSPTS